MTHKSIITSTTKVFSLLIVGDTVESKQQLIIYGTAQFKLDRTCVQHGLDMTHFSFHTRASIHVHTRLMTLNLPCKTLMYALDVCMTVFRCVPNLNYTCMQIVSQRRQNKLYKHVHVLRCNITPIVIQDVKPAKEFLTVKLKQLEGVSFTDYHR